MKRIFKKYFVFSKGFSLIELIIGMFALGILMTITGAIFVSMIRTQGKSLNIQKIQENAQFIFEIMGRELRVANCISTDPACRDNFQRIPDSSCTNASPQTSLIFKHPINGTVIYSLAGQVINRTVGGLTGQLTSNDVQVKSLNFCIKNNAFNDLAQPRITVLIGFSAGIGKDAVSINLQTSLSPRFVKD